MQIAEISERLGSRKGSSRRGAFENLFATAPMPVAVLRGHGLVLELANEAALCVVGGEDAIGKPLGEALPEIERHGLGNTLRGVLDDGVAQTSKLACLTLDRPGMTGPETTCWSSTCARLCGGGSHEPRVIVMFFDVTLQVRVRRALGRRLAEAHAASRAKDQFIAMLSHELRNPLFRIMTSLEVMRLRGADEREQAIVERQVRLLARLVDDLLDLSRIRLGIVDLKKQPTEMADVVAAAVETVGPVIDGRDQSLVVNVPQELVVEVDADRMSQVISNLLTNAAKYSNERSEIRIVTTEECGNVRLAVIDRGIGIEPARLEEVFEPFVGNGDQDGCGPNYGLGLTVARNLVRLHGGEIHVNSDGPGTGCEFVVELPSVSRSQAS